MVRHSSSLLLCISISLGGLTAHVRAQETRSEASEIERLAEEAFIYGFPMVMNIANIHSYCVDTKAPQYKGPFNQISSDARIFTPSGPSVPLATNDTAISFLVMDLRVEPLVLSVPQVEKERYFCVQFIDLYTCNFAYLGSRATDNAAGTYLIAGPKWQGEAPAGVTKTLRCETELALAIYRTQLFNPDDMVNVRNLQSQCTVQPLSQLLNTAPPPPAPTIGWTKVDWKQAGVNALTTLNFALQFCPAVGSAQVEVPLREDLSHIGIEPGRVIDLGLLVTRQKDPLLAGIRKAADKIKVARVQMAINANGWLMGSAYGDRSYYNGNWLLRAAGAMAGIYGNDPEEFLIAPLAVDAEGLPPDCASKRYTLTFPPDQLPPVNAFWSLTMYDGRTQMLVDNPLNRFAINSRMLEGMQMNADGSLTIHVQNDSPGKEKQSNWLPAPDGPALMMLRLYWPKDAAVKGQWMPPVLTPVRP